MRSMPASLLKWTRVNNILLRSFSCGHMKYSQIHDQNRIIQKPLDRVTAILTSAIEAIRNPHTGEGLADLGEMTAEEALRNMRDDMMGDAEGQAVLRDRPLIHPATLSEEYLRGLPQGSVGYHIKSYFGTSFVRRAYQKFMDINGFSSEGRRVVRYVEDEELGYVMTRYRQLHDFQHTLYDLNISIPSELALKIVELYQTSLP
eukprot:Filipodium_phascolosomae@DN1554_c0_g1_i3.p1